MPDDGLVRRERRQLVVPRRVRAGDGAGQGRDVCGEQAGCLDIVETQVRQPAAEESAGAEVVQQSGGEGVPAPTVSTTGVATAGTCTRSPSSEASAPSAPR
ncbi:hypothetical protein SHIRM173S_08727 [Streptomyces hirsutus]